MSSNWIKSKLAELNKKNGDPRIWKPKPGKQKIRIVPYKYNKEVPFVELFFYYGLKREQILSPWSFQKPDPIKKFSDKLLNTQGDDNYKMGKMLEPKRRVSVPIVVRGAEHEGVKIWQFGDTTYQQLLDAIDESDFGDIWNPASGRDITVVHEKAKGPQSFAKTNVIISPRESVLSADKETLKGLLTDMPKIEDMWECPTPDQLKEILEDFLGDKDDTPDDNDKKFSKKMSSKKTTKDEDEEDEEDEEVEEEDEEEETEEDEEADDEEEETEEDEEEEPVSTKKKSSGVKGKTDAVSSKTKFDKYFKRG
jgi:hypothetical protein